MSCGVGGQNARLMSGTVQLPARPMSCQHMLNRPLNSSTAGPHQCSSHARFCGRQAYAWSSNASISKGISWPTQQRQQRHRQQFVSFERSDAGIVQQVCQRHLHSSTNVTTVIRAAAAAAGDPAQQQPDQQQQSSNQQQQQQQQQQQELVLPPSRSAALWLQDLDDTQLQQQAQDWGYQQIGRPLPEGLSLGSIAATIPEEHFQLDLFKAVGYLALSVAVMAAGYSYLWYWHSLCPLWQQLACWGVIGTGYFGVFQSAVDCSRFAFWPLRPRVQDLLGALLMAPALVSYELFRLKYLNHLMCVNQLYEDTEGWHPILPEDLAEMPRWQRVLLQLVMATPLKFVASIGQWFRSLDGFDLKLYPAETRGWMWLSWALPLGFIGVVWPAMIAAGGVSGWASWWLGPWVVFHAWLSVLSLVQHTAPHIPWTEEGVAYDQAQAAINGTVTLQLPQWLEVVLHHANYHLPTHVAIDIPSYNLKAAHQYLQQRLGRYLTIADLNPRLLINLMTAWQVYNEQQQRYVDFDEAEVLVQQYRQHQQQEQQEEQEGCRPTAAARDDSSSSGSSAWQAAGSNGVTQSTSSSSSNVNPIAGTSSTTYSSNSSSSSSASGSTTHQQQSPAFG